MSNINMNAQEGGRIVQASEVPTANNFGNRVARPVETAKVVRGTFGDASGEAMAADMEMKAAQQVAAVAQDTIKTMTNLQIAEEETQKQNHLIELQTAERNARSASRQAAIDKGLNTDEEYEEYQRQRGASIDEINAKYNYLTKVGNDVDARVQIFKEQADSVYQNEIVIPRRVDNVKTRHMQTLEMLGKQLADLMAGENNPETVGRLLSDHKKNLYEMMHSPQFIAVWGAASAEEQYQKRLTQDVVDAVASVTNTDPHAAVEMLRNQTGDIATDPLFELDPSTRRELLYQAERERSSRDAETRAKLKEEQDANEFALFMDITQGKLSGNSGVATVYKARMENRIDQGHAERLISKLEMDADRRERRAQAAEERAARAAEKRDLLLSPVRDALELGLPLDPKNPSHVKSVEAYAQELIKKSGNANAVEVMTELTTKTGVAPRMLTSAIHGLVSSKDPKQSIQGTQILAQIAEKAPNIIHQLNDETVSKANQINLGVHPEQAQLLIERARTLTKEQKEEYKKIGTKALPKLETELKNTFGVSKKDVTPEAYGHARDVFQDQLILSGGNVDAALESTKALVRKSYGVSYLTGTPTLMFNAPEGAAGKTDWMTQQFATDLKGLGLKPEQVRLKANADGSYDLFAVRNGVVTGHVVDPNTGKKLTWEPDQAAAAKQVRDAQLAEAQKKREEYLSAKPNPFTTGAAFNNTEMNNFVPRGAKPSPQLNTSEQPQFGKFKKSETN